MARTKTAQRTAANRIIFVDGAFEWPDALRTLLQGEGYVAVHTSEMDSLPELLLRGSVAAVLVGARPLGAKDLLTLQECRGVFPGVAVVVLATPPAQPELKRAFDIGATAFLSWPAPIEAVRRALASGGRERTAECATTLHVEGPAPPGSLARALADAVHGALAGLAGPWDVTIRPSQGSFTVTIVGPDARLWSMVSADADPVTVAGRVQAACARCLGGTAGDPPVRAHTGARRCK